ncbi:hypothetical protein SLE2022_307140 [Rubroshorea leprosula]
MAFFSKVGSILRQTASKQIINAEWSTSTPKASIFQAIRCFSSMSSSKLFIGGLSYSTDDYQLREAFSKYGEVMDARVIVDRETGRSRGFGFITFSSNEEASSAIQALDGQVLHGRNIRVNYANERPPRNFGGGGYNPGYGAPAGGYGSNYGGNFGGGNYGPPSGSYGGNAGYGANTFGSQGNAYGDVAGGVSNNYAGPGEGSGLGGADFGFGKDNQFDSTGNVENADAAGGYGQNDAVDGNFRDEDDDDLMKRA